MPVTVEKLVTDGVLSPLDMGFAQLAKRLDKHRDEDVALAAALVSWQLARGHVCLDLADTREITFAVDADSQQPRFYDDWPPIDGWVAKLQDSCCVVSRDLRDPADALDRPLVLDTKHQQLYLARYWYFQQKLARDIAQRSLAKLLLLDENRLAVDIARLFPDRARSSDFDQCVAAAQAVDRRISVITGGPGTGKTTTVAKLIALRLMQQPDAAGDACLKILLMAPTGKAAQRLNESMGRATRQLDLPDLVRTQLAAIRAGTIHRLLGWTPLPPERGGPFQHTADFPLDADMVLVDEASMVDLSLMWRLVAAVRPDAQVILIGDRDQLASVEAGGVLGDLCGNLAELGSDQTSAERRALIARRTGLSFVGDTPARAHALAEMVMPLHYSHRFDPASTLGQLAARIRAGDAESVLEILRNEQGREPRQVEWLQPSPGHDGLAKVVELVAADYVRYLELLCDSPQGTLDILAALNRARVLSAYREGRWGQEQLNRRITDCLAKQGLIKPSRATYVGRPVLVTRNDYRQKLFNGDVGVVVQNEAGDGRVIVFEESSAPDGCRRVPAALVPYIQSCFAMTIHKSQGSEFHRVYVVLPAYQSPLLTRELLYTAVTRVCDETDPVSKRRSDGKLFLLGSEDVIRAAVTQRVRRTSGLREALELLNVD